MFAFEIPVHIWRIVLNHRSHVCSNSQNLARRQTEIHEVDVSNGVQPSRVGDSKVDKVDGINPTPEEEATFKSLGLCDWILTACKAMGFRRPTPVQQHCIPAVRLNVCAT